MKRIIKHNILLLIILIPSFQVASAQKLFKRDLASMYSEYHFTSFDVNVYHSSKARSTVYLNVKLHMLAYVPHGPDGTPTANFAVHYELYESYSSKSPRDTASVTFSDSDHYGEEMEMAVDFEIPATFPGRYILKLTLEDLNQPGNWVHRYVHVYKENLFSGQNYHMTTEEDFPLFGGYVLQDSYFRIRYVNPEVNQLIIRYYDQRFPIAKPPFAMEKNVTYTFEPDSFYTVQLEGGITPLLELPYQGIYYIQTDLGDPDGLTLYRFDEGFPLVNIPAQALAPLRYLTTEREYDKLLAYDDYKVAIDSFWLERASYEPERAKNMIKKFYQRVVDVNRMFTSYQEGWKTDRGLLYIIYGPPSEVYRKDGEEEWLYGEKGNPMSIRFFFLKSDNPFTENDLTLQRSPIYKTSWYIAIENWRR